MDDIKDIAYVAAPFTKIVLETFLLPKFKEIRDSWKRDKKIVDHSFENKFHEYLLECYEKNAILNTLAFKKRKVFLNDVYQPLTIVNEESRETIKLEEFSLEIFKNSSKVLIVDSAGMGKSTLSKKLLVSCIEKNGAVPILIELRRLTKNKDIVDEILEQINPINEEIDKQFVLDLIKRGDFLFFFDGFDEISIPERKRVTELLQKFFVKASKNKFIVTSRPEDSLVSFGDFQNFSISPLEFDEALSLLRKYDNKGEISELLISKIKEPEIYNNIIEYLDTPLLVSLLFTAFEHKQKIPFKKHIFYRQVFDALFESHDLSKGDSFERDKYSGLGIDEFLRVLRIFGFMCLTNENKIEFNRDELETIINKCIKFCPDLDFKASDFIKDIIVTVPIFVKDGIYFKWAHKSLQEYFAAHFIYLDSKDKQKEILTKLCFNKRNNLYLNVIDLYFSIDPKGFRHIIIYQVLKDYFSFIQKSYKSFSGDRKRERQELEFGHELNLINFPFSKGEKEFDSSSDLLDLVFKEIKTKTRISIRTRVEVDQEFISNIKVPEIKRPIQTILEFLYAKGVDFIQKKHFDQVPNFIDLKLPLKKVVKVNDRKNSILNRGENFTKTNDIVKHFFKGKKNFVIIDSVKAKSMLREIESSIRNTSSDLSLTF